MAQVEQIFRHPVVGSGFDNALALDIVVLIHQGSVHAVGLFDSPAIRLDYFNVENPER